MSFFVGFWEGFNKQLNSTRQPDNNERFNYNCILKDGCSVTRPVIRIIDVSAAENLGNYNYAQITVFNRYYYVRDTKWVDRAWEMELVCDVLASYKNIIGKTYMYVLRSSDINLQDLTIIDTRYFPKGDPYFVKQSHAFSWADSPASENGSFVLGVINKSSTVAGGISYYVLNGAQIARLRSFMLGNITGDWREVSSYTGDIVQAFIDPFQYIVSCMWFPYEVPTTGASENISFGFWESAVPGNVLTNYTSAFGFDLKRPNRQTGDEAETRGVWAMQEPFAKYWFYNSMFGIVPIDGQEINSSGLGVILSVDYTTGSAVLTLKSNKADNAQATDGVIYTACAQIGVAVQLSQITNESAASIGNVRGMLSSVRDLAIGGLAGALNGDLASGAVGATTKIGGQISGNGSLAANRASGNVFTLLAQYYYPQTEDITEQGRPVCVWTTPNSTGHYYEIWEGNITMSGTDEEKQEVKGYLEGGFFYE